MGSSIKKWLNITIWPIDGTLTSTTNPGQSGPGSNGNEGVFYIPQSSSLTIRCSLVLYPRHSFERDVTPLQGFSQCILHPQPIGLFYKFKNRFRVIVNTFFYLFLFGLFILIFNFFFYSMMDVSVNKNTYVRF